MTCNFGDRGSYLFGWDNIAQHHCKLDFGLRSSNPDWIQNCVDYELGPLNIAFNRHPRLIAATVVRAAGLDDKIAMVSGMDTKSRDMRFGCSVSPLLKRNTTSWVKVHISDANSYVPVFYSILSNSHGILARFHIVPLACIAPRASSSCSLQMPWQRSKKAKWLIHLINGRAGTARSTLAT